MTHQAPAELVVIIFTLDVRLSVRPKNKNAPHNTKVRVCGSF